MLLDIFCTYICKLYYFFFFKDVTKEAEKFEFETNKTVEAIEAIDQSLALNFIQDNHFNNLFYEDEQLRFAVADLVAWIKELESTRINEVLNKEEFIVDIKEKAKKFVQPLRLRRNTYKTVFASYIMRRSLDVQLFGELTDLINDIKEYEDANEHSLVEAEELLGKILQFQ
jgi:hypothetical protein